LACLLAADRSNSAHQSETYIPISQDCHCAFDFVQSFAE
jgi:hypothetical protein